MALIICLISILIIFYKYKKILSEKDDEIERITLEKNAKIEKITLEKDDEIKKITLEKNAEIEKITNINNELTLNMNDFLKKNSEIVKYHEIVDNLQKNIEDLNNSFNEKNEHLNAEYTAKKNELDKVLDELEKSITCKIIDITNYENITSEECKNKLSILKTEINDLIKNGKAVKLLAGADKSKKEINANTKQIILCFTAECANIINNLTVKNVDTARSKIERSYNTINKVFEVDGLQLNKPIFEKKLEELSLVYAHMQKLEQEREEQKAIREQMLEEEKVRREIEREKIKIEKEENQFKNEITKLMSYLQKASDIEKQLYVDKIRELEEKLKLLEKDKENVLEREQNTRAGYVYIISNIGSFGDNIYKIGMTRRLEPMDRVKELGDASVPFEFDVHAMIFSSDAPALETTLHNTFKGREVNKVNLKKEFYRVTLDEIEKVVKEKYNATVTFTKIAEASQYKQTLEIEKNMIK